MTNPAKQVILDWVIIMSEELNAMFYPLSEDEQKLEKQFLRNEPFVAADPIHLATQKTHFAAGKKLVVGANPRFVTTLRHKHEFVEMAYCLNGSVTHTFDDGTVMLQKGELLILNQNVYHAVQAAGRDDIMVNILVIPAYFESVFTVYGMEETPLYRFFLQCLLGDGKPGYLYYKIGDILPLRNLIETLIWSVKNELPFKRSTNQLTMALFLRLLQFYSDLEQSSRIEKDNVWLAEQYIEEHYRDGTLEEAAKLLHCDYYRLSHEMREKTGATFTELMQERRLRQAKFLLESTDIPVIKIGADVGYNNMSYFYKLFHEAFGITPKQYREEKRK